MAVLPFENATGDPAIDYLSDGISESLINTLSRLPGLRVISRTSAFAFKGQKLGPREIGRKLGVDALLLGTLVQRGADLAISAELVSVRDDTHLWGEKYSRRSDDVLKVEGEIAATIARTLRRKLSGEEAEKLARRATVDPEAYRLYLKGRDRLVGNQQEMDKTIGYLQQAVARAPDYALAHAGLAEAYTRQAFLRAVERGEALGKARASVDRALELDPDLAEAHAALALVKFYFEWDWAGAETEFRRALELNPGSQTVHEEYGAFLTLTARLDEGLAESRKAAELDPLSVSPVHDIAINYMVRGDLEQAAANFRRTIEIDPNWTWGYIKLARTLAHQKKCKEALAQAETAEVRIAGGVAPLSRSWLGYTYAICGETARARKALEELHALAARAVRGPGDLCHGARQPRRVGRGVALVREGLCGPDAKHGRCLHSPPARPRARRRRPLRGDRPPHGIPVTPKLSPEGEALSRAQGLPRGSSTSGSWTIRSSPPIPLDPLAQFLFGCRDTGGLEWDGPSRGLLSFATLPAAARPQPPNRPRPKIRSRSPPPPSS